MSKKVEDYVCGLMFTSYNFVMLIRKARPEWQAGRFNGIGGKVEDGEFPVNAMVREFREETGVDTVTHNWRMFANVVNKDGSIVHFFVGHMTGVPAITACEEEPVSLFSIRDLPANVINNIRWLIPLALDYSAPIVTVVY